MSSYFNLKSFRLGMLCGIVTAFIFTLYACGGEDNDPVAEEPEEEEKVFLDLPEASMSHTFSSDGGVFSVDFTSSHAWTAEVASGVVSWLHVSPEQGEGGASTIQITADENTRNTPRTGTVTIRSGELSRTISVTQQGRVLDLPEASMSHTFSSDGGVFSVDFTSSHAWTAEVASGVVSWLHVSPEQGEGGASTIQITADENTGNTPRTGTVTIRSGELSRTISVTQQERVIVPGSDGPDDMPIEPW